MTQQTEHLSHIMTQTYQLNDNRSCEYDVLPTVISIGIDWTDIVRRCRKTRV